MKLFRSSLLMLSETAAFGWFILKDLSFLAVLPLIPLGVLYCYLSKVQRYKILWLNGICALFSIFITSYVASQGLFEGKGLVALLCLSLSVGMMGVQACGGELERISGWWMSVFLIIFVVMSFATLSGARWRYELPSIGNWFDILFFYVLAFSEPLSLGKDYRAAPLALGILMIPFGVVSYLALGPGAFSMAEYPYLAVWSGVSISSFHHLEGIILGLYYGAGMFRAAHFLGHFQDRMTKKVTV